MKNIVVVGLGEIGTALKKVEEVGSNKVFVFEKETIEQVDGNIDIMHICIPFFKGFNDIVANYINSYKPTLTIIHSTTQPRTCETITKMIKYPMVHSPCRGVHPHLYKGLVTFIKYVGGPKDIAQKAIEHFKSVNIKAEYLGDYITTELAKVISTTYYGSNILFAKMVKEICLKYDCNYEKVYTKPTITYNEGYTKLGMEHVVRPTLYPPTGKISGHCISENFELLPNTRLKRIMKEINENA